jgi:hypothetical protein
MRILIANACRKYGFEGGGLRETSGSLRFVGLADWLFSAGGGQTAVLVRPNVGANRPVAAGQTGPAADNATRCCGRAWLACRGGSGSARG